MSGKKSRTKGHAFERSIKNKLIDHFPDIDTSRNASKKRDDEKVDFVGTDPYNFQCKAQEAGVYPHKILSEMPEDGNINILVHKKNRQGTVCSLYLEDFLEILKLIPKKPV